jgi:hypothetical protein
VNITKIKQPSKHATAIEKPSDKKKLKEKKMAANGRKR